MKSRRVLVDACLLVKGNVSNVLLDLHSTGLIRLHWSPEIGIQFVNNWTKRRVAEEEGDRVQGGLSPLGHEELKELTSNKRSLANNRLNKFQLIVPEWYIPGWSYPKLSKLVTRQDLKVGSDEGVDEGDYHVALAAIGLKKAFIDDEIWLATENVVDLPPPIMGQFDVKVIDQGQLLEYLHRIAPDMVRQSIEKTIADTKRPPLTREDMLDVIGSINGFGSELVKIDLARSWGINLKLTKKPTAKERSRIQMRKSSESGSKK